MSLKLRHLGKQGDTIIEVLICMAVVGFSLSVSYAISRASFLQVRDAEERGQSTALAQQQLERLKEFLKEHPTLSTKNPHNGTSWLLNPGRTDGIMATYEAPPTGPGFCIYKDMLHVHYTYDTTDPACAVNEKGEYFCEVATNYSNNAFCNGSVVVNDTNKALVDNAGYPYRAGVAYPASDFSYLFPEYGDDQFFAAAGRFEVGGKGNNAFEYSVVSIPYRIHQ